MRLPRHATPLALVAAGALATLVAAGALLLRERPPEQPPPEGRAPTEPAHPAPAAPYVVELPNALEAVNDDGSWTVYTRCLGPRALGREATVGPGYVARLVTADGLLLVDDAREAGNINDTDFGGLGAFGWHHARGRPGSLRFGADNAWEISGRVCAADNAGFGVVSSELVEPPRRRADARGTYVGFALDVAFSDGLTFPQPLLRVRYRYRVYRDAVLSAVAVTQLCHEGRCGRGDELAFVKEPKLVAHLNADGPLPFTRMATLDEEGEVVCSFRSGGGLEGPVLHTGQCDDPTRTTLRFDSEGDCREQLCLDVTMRAAPGAGGDVDPEAPTARWQSGEGFDAWALAAADRPAAYPEDTGSLDGVVWPCHGGSPADARQRRWEVTGRQDAEGRYHSLGGLFPAWEGGRGAYDCEPLSRTFGPHGETVAAVAEYSLSRPG